VPLRPLYRLLPSTSDLLLVSSGTLTNRLDRLSERERESLERLTSKLLASLAREDG
jgi:hypothetical protein